ncbi:hypothetical protein T11_2088 [Trichinella zimbabwensis]|uniref:Uncharacterized protein n=1 Tax=Trichinella zimbabwensis TaxID=268475 RepID=A0A0V1GZQ9_9BILA|nr:hypothetical protein T11_2088 [Trichinella zimbabwensis]
MLQEYQQKTKRSGKVFQDSITCHPSCELLDRENSLFSQWIKLLFKMLRRRFGVTT